MSTYGYVLVVIALGNVLRYTLFRAPSIYVQQSRFIVIGSLVPFLTNLLHNFGIYRPLPGMELAPLVFAIASPLYAWALFRWHLLDLVPVAHATVFESIPEGVIVLDHAYRVLEWNVAATKMCLSGRPDRDGRRIRTSEWKHRRVQFVGQQVCGLLQGSLALVVDRFELDRLSRLSATATDQITVSESGRVWLGKVELIDGQEQKISDYPLRTGERHRIFQVSVTALHAQETSPGLSDEDGEEDDFLAASDRRVRQAASFAAGKVGRGTSGNLSIEGSVPAVGRGPSGTLSIEATELRKRPLPAELTLPTLPAGVKEQRKQQRDNPQRTLDLYDRRSRGCLVLLRDVTAMKEFERELIRERAVADAANQAKSSFLATMSRELMKTSLRLAQL